MNYLDFGITKLDVPTNARPTGEGWSLTKHVLNSATEAGSHLIDTTTKSFLMTALQKSHETRMKYYSIVFNFAVFMVFILVFGFVLYYRYKSKPTREEANYKIIKDQEYVLSKIRFYQEEHKKIQDAAKEYSTMLTDLPMPPVANHGII